MPATTGMKGAGYYDQHSAAQQASIRLVFDWIEDAVASLALPPASQPLVVLDLGSSEGRNAVLAMNTVVEAVRRRRAEQVIQTVYSDLPSNNFNQLFTNLNQARMSGGLATEVYPSAVAGSFYEPLLPSALRPLRHGLQRPAVAGCIAPGAGAGLCVLSPTAPTPAGTSRVAGIGRRLLRPGRTRPASFPGVPCPRAGAWRQTPGGQSRRRRRTPPLRRTL